MRILHVPRSRALVPALLLACAALCGCDRFVISHLRNDTGDTLGILRNAQGTSWCWSRENSALDTYRLAPGQWVRLGYGVGRGVDDAIEAIRCDSIMIVTRESRRLLTRESLAAGEIVEAGSTVFFIVK